MRHKALRLPDELSKEITRRARMKGVPDADCIRLLLDRGLLLKGVEMAMQTPIPPAYSGPCEAVIETRNILRSLAAARNALGEQAAKMGEEDVEHLFGELCLRIEFPQLIELFVHWARGGDFRAAKRFYAASPARRSTSFNRDEVGADAGGTLRHSGSRVFSLAPPALNPAVRRH